VIAGSLQGVLTQPWSEKVCIMPNINRYSIAVWEDITIDCGAIVASSY